MTAVISAPMGTGYGRPLTSYEAGLRTVVGGAVTFQHHTARFPQGHSEAAGRFVGWSVTSARCTPSRVVPLKLHDNEARHRMAVERSAVLHLIDAKELGIYSVVLVCA